MQEPPTDPTLLAAAWQVAQAGYTHFQIKGVVAHSPTLGTMAYVNIGTIIRTLSFMAPERPRVLALLDQCDPATAFVYLAVGPAGECVGVWLMDAPPLRFDDVRRA